MPRLAFARCFMPKPYLKSRQRLFEHTNMATAQQRPWCLFTSAGERNALSLWLENGPSRRWDLVVAYYGDDDREFSQISELSSHAFRTKGGKFESSASMVFPCAAAHTTLSRLDVMRSMISSSRCKTS